MNGKIMLYLAENNGKISALSCTSPLAGVEAARRNLLKAIREQKPKKIIRIG